MPLFWVIVRNFVWPPRPQARQRQWARWEEGKGTQQDTWSELEGAQLELLSSLECRVLNSKFENTKQNEDPNEDPWAARIFVPKIHFVNWKPLKVILWKALSHETCNMTIDIAGIRHGASPTNSRGRSLAAPLPLYLLPARLLLLLGTLLYKW